MLNAAILRKGNNKKRSRQRYAPKGTLCGALALLGMSGLAVISPARTTAQTQAQMNAAAGKAYDKADGQMNAAYRKLMSVLDAEQKQQLKTAQVAWLKFRDAEAALRSSKVKGGSVYPTVYAAHLQEITQARTQELTRSYKLFTTEGDM